MTTRRTQDLSWALLELYHLAVSLDYPGAATAEITPDLVKVAQLCLTLCDPMDYTAHGILQAKILEWVAFPFSRGIFPAQVSCIASELFTS